MSVPIMALLLIVSYFLAAALLGTTPPFSVVSGQSMRPTFAPGDLVVIEGVAAGDLEVGDVISIVPPIREQEEKGLPDEIVHRIIEVVDTDGQRSFLTKGDNNPGEDAFITFPSNVRGEVVARAPALGFPLLFFRSEQGRVLAIAAGLALIGYFVISAIERRQEAAALENPRALIEEVREDNLEIKDAMRELVGAVSEYGEHLRSHTGAVQGMSDASRELATVAAGLRGSTAEPRARPVAAEPRHDRRPTAVPIPPPRPRLTPRFEPPALEPDLGTEVLAYLRRTAQDGWLDLDLGELSSSLGTPIPVLEGVLAELAIGGHLRAVATLQSVNYLVRLR